MFSPHEVEAAKLKMGKARKALDGYESIHGYASSAEHATLLKDFNKTAESYLLISTRSFLKERNDKT
jgi:hypothetical protein